MENRIRNAQSLEILKTRLNKDIKDIYVTGWTEIRENYHYFSTMDWWYYIEFENFFLCIEALPTIGTIRLRIEKGIQCNFEIDEDDIFTVKTIDNKTYLGQEIVEFDLFYSNNNHELFALGIQFKDNKYVHKDSKYVFFNSLNFDGIEIGSERNKHQFSKDDCFYLEKLK